MAVAFCCPIEAQVIGKRLNRGGGYGLEIPIIYRFYDQEKLVNWLIKKIEAVKKELECKVSKCLKKKLRKEFKKKGQIYYFVQKVMSVN